MSPLTRTSLWCLLCAFGLALTAGSAQAATIGPNAIEPGASWSHEITGTGQLQWHIHPTGAMYSVEVPADSDDTTQTVTVRIVPDGDDVTFEPAEPTIEQGDTIEFVNDADATQDLMLFTPSGGMDAHDGHGDGHGDHDAAESPAAGAVAFLAAAGLALLARRHR